MTNKLVEEAPFQPGYEDAGFKKEVSPMIAELVNLRRSNARYVGFSEAIVSFCRSSQLSQSTVS